MLKCELSRSIQILLWSGIKIEILPSPTWYNPIFILSWYWTTIQYRGRTALRSAVGFLHLTGASLGRRMFSLYLLIAPQLKHKAVDWNLPNSTVFHSNAINCAVDKTSNTVSIFFNLVVIWVKRHPRFDFPTVKCPSILSATLPNGDQRCLTFTLTFHTLRWK